MDGIHPISPGTFPSLIIASDRLEPRGAFAESQAAYLQPDAGAVAELDRALRDGRAGVVAHFYMDPELQGVLSSCSWPHVHVSDSLAMADRAVTMVRAGVETVIVLGVDFMSENVRAMLDAAGYEHVPVYRVASEPVGCTLAEAAEARAYGAWLAKAAETPRSLHVIYINTSLRVKAKAHALVPTITCTSSNVVKMVLQAFAQVPDLHVWFGPDTYMGHNLEHLFEALAGLDDRAIHSVHPAHERASLASLRGRFHAFEQGTCVVHHMFGKEVAERVQRDYPDAAVTAHLEVPGEMFELGAEAQRRGEGVVGSTSDILSFITSRVERALAAHRPARLQFVLGTEAGMITSIVRQVQERLRDGPNTGVEAEVVFPVASEAVAAAPGSELGVVPGVAAGEGCGVAGGCATCPFMKMNSLDALMDLLRRLRAEPAGRHTAYEPHKYIEAVAGRTVADLGSEPILHMREFQRTGALPAALVQDVLTRRSSRVEPEPPAAT